MIDILFRQAILLTSLINMEVKDLPKTDSKNCEICAVEWRDAAIHTHGDLSNTSDSELTVDTVTFGCVSQTERTVVIILSFAGGKPDIFIAVPKDWVIKITPLIRMSEEKKEASP